MQLFASRALLPDGWHDDVLFVVGDGRFTAITPRSMPGHARRLSGPAVPGLPNVHSHAFQRAMAGLAEVASGEDSFWGWRELMYRFVARLTPDDVEAIAAQLYAELLESGTTTVGEFHYLARQPGGTPYDDPAELAERIVAAAADTGMGLCLLPVIYERGGFDGRALEGAQLRFRQDEPTARRVAERIARHGVAVGVAPHSLRAVRPASLALDGLDPGWPIHIHVAEQRREVEACLAATGARPVAWLLDHAAVDRRWCLVHATHTTTAERAGILGRGAVAGLCPTTEANLGDGIFPARDFWRAGGLIGFGSDSHVCTSVAEELRLLEYGQRLMSERRNVLARPGASTGRTLFDAALAGGSVVGHPAGLAKGARADLVVLDPEHPAMVARSDDAWLDAWIFASGRPPVRDVYAAGRLVVENGRHTAGAIVLARFKRILARLLS